MIDVDKEKLKEKMRKLYTDCPSRYLREVARDKNTLEGRVEYFIEQTDKKLELNVVEFLNNEQLSNIYIDDITLYDLMTMYTRSLDYEKIYNSYEIFDVILELSFYNQQEGEKSTISLWPKYWTEIQTPYDNDTSPKQKPQTGLKAWILYAFYLTEIDLNTAKDNILRFCRKIQNKISAVK